jgi:hypothetical protein
MELNTANLIATRGSNITNVGDPSSVAQDLPPTIQTDVTPSMDVDAAAPKGVRFVAAGLRKLSEWRAFFHLHNNVPSSTKPKLLTYFGHANVLILHFDIPAGRCHPRQQGL